MSDEAIESPRPATEPLPRRKFFIVLNCVGVVCLITFVAYWLWLKRPWWGALFFAIGSFYMGTVGLLGLRRARRNQSELP